MSLTHYSPVTRQIEKCQGNCKYGEDAITTDSDGNEFQVMHSRPGESPMEFLQRVERYEEVAAMEREGGVYGTVTKSSEPEPRKTLEDFEDKRNPEGAYAVYQLEEDFENKIKNQHDGFEFEGGKLKYGRDYHYRGEIGHLRSGLYTVQVVYDEDTGEFQRGTIGLREQPNSWDMHMSAGEDYYTQEEFEKSLYYNGILPEKPESDDDMNPNADLENEYEYNLRHHMEPS